MNPVSQFIDAVLHLDTYLTVIIAHYGTLAYLIVFLIIFAETGLVVTPMLPGDSLLFVAGTIAATGALDIIMVAITITIAAILGDTVNYWIGSIIGPRVFHEKSRWFRKEHLDKTKTFYEKHGAKTIVIARFIPIVRTFAPFVAGIGAMHYPRFLVYNIIGGILWVLVFVGGGYYFGNIPFVQKHFSLVILAIIIVSFIPPILDWLSHRKGKNDMVEQLP